MACEFEPCYLPALSVGFVVVSIADGHTRVREIGQIELGPGFVAATSEPRHGDLALGGAIETFRAPGCPIHPTKQVVVVNAGHAVTQTRALAAVLNRLNTAVTAHARLASSLPPNNLALTSTSRRRGEAPWTFMNRKLT